MFGDESMFCTEVFWCGTDHLPEIDSAGLPFLGSPPPTLRNQKGGEPGRGRGVAGVGRGCEASKCTGVNWYIITIKK